MRNLFSLISLVALGLAAACGGDGVTDPFDVAGVYPLETVDGNRLPYTVSDASGSATLLSDVLTVRADGTWVEQYTIRVTANGQTSTQSDSDAGTYSRTGSEYTFTSNGEVFYTGTHSGRSFTLTDGGSTWVFSR